MVSNLRKIISEIADKNKITVEGYKMDKIALVEKHLNENSNIDAAMSELDGILGFHWDKYYDQIKKEL